MSIDARVESVRINEDGSGELRLTDRPATKPGAPKGIAGQPSLAFESAPEEVTALNGRDIWGGDSSIMLGDVRIGDRVGWGGIRFRDADTLKQAVAAVGK